MMSLIVQASTLQRVIEAKEVALDQVEKWKKSFAQLKPLCNREELEELKSQMGSQQQEAWTLKLAAQEEQHQQQLQQAITAKDSE